jgi:hypothetical protein
MPTPKDQKALDLEGAEPCQKHGFQNEEGFEVDEVVGEIKVPVILCHSKRHKAPKKRFIMLTPEGTFRVHDYGWIHRRHGRQTVNDRWTSKRCAKERAVEWAKRQLEALKGKGLRALLDLLAKI